MQRGVSTKQGGGNPRHFKNEFRDKRLRIGISACLLGEKVRFDGGHKQDRYLTQTLGEYFEWVPVCPEVELGLGAPRPTMRLERVAQEIRLVVPMNGRDLTGPMREFAKTRVRQLAHDDLDGYILKSDSPSCGLLRVRVYGQSRVPERSGRGVFAEALTKKFSHLPIEEEGRLSDPRLRENWIERVFAYHHIKSFWRSRWTLQSLVVFHTAQKLVILAHSPKAYRKLGQLVARAKRLSRRELRLEYHAQFMGALEVLATRGRHANVLRHMSGYFKKGLDTDARRELSDLIEDYQAGEVPLIVPLTLIKHYVRRLNSNYLAGQVYLDPHPKELALRNHV